jgi:hypothetical protein
MNIMEAVLLEKCIPEIPDSPTPGKLSGSNFQAHLHSLTNQVLISRLIYIGSQTLRGADLPKDRSPGTHLDPNISLGLNKMFQSLADLKFLSSAFM